MKQKKQSFEIQLYSIGESNNPTQKPVEFILHDFEVNYNNSQIKKEIAEKALPTLKGMPIVAKYHKVSQPGSNDDALGGHEAYINEDRDGDLIIATDTLAIGVFTEPAYIDTIVDNGEEIEVVKGKGILWSSRYPDIVGLLEEWWNRDIPVKSSMEILYDEYHFKDGVEEILNYVYEGHCVLNSEERGGHSVVLPAYDVSQITQFQRLVAQALKKDEEGETMNFKKVFELSHSDIRALLYNEMSAKMTEEEYNYSWIEDVYDSSFVYYIWTEDLGTKHYKINYTKSDSAVTIDWESKIEVIEERKWVEVTEVQNLQAQLNDANSKVEEITKQLNEVSESLTQAKQEKEDVVKQFNEATEKLTSLNEQVEELKPFKEKFETDQYEKTLNEKIEFYSVKFEAVNAKEKFETEEVQNLIKLSIEDSEEGKNAVFSINSMLIDLVQVKPEKENTPIKELASKKENLISTSDNFDSRYSE